MEPRHGPNQQHSSVLPYWSLSLIHHGSSPHRSAMASATPSAYLWRRSPPQPRRPSPRSHNTATHIHRPIAVAPVNPPQISLDLDLVENNCERERTRGTESVVGFIAWIGGRARYGGSCHQVSPIVGWSRWMGSQQRKNTRVLVGGGQF